jgi:hypothetical protein
MKKLWRMKEDLQKMAAFLTVRHWSVVMTDLLVRMFW